MTLIADPAGAVGPASTAAPAVERELRFHLTDSMRAEFADRDVDGLVQPARRLRSVHFDTADAVLMRQGIALRVRGDGHGFVQSVERRAGPDLADGGLDPFDRVEWEHPVAAAALSADALPPRSDPAGLAIRACFDRLVPLFETDFQRRSRLVAPDDRVRLALASDVGLVRAGSATEPIAEVEIEQLAGAPAVFYRYVLQWARLHGASLSDTTRDRRGLALAGLPVETAAATRFVAPPPPTSDDTGEAARTVLRALQANLLANLAVARDGDDPAGPRAIGIALQRLRSAIAFFELREDPVRATDQPWRAIDRMAGRLQERTAAIRELDRLERELLRRLETWFPGDAALAALAAAARAESARCRTRLRTLLTAGFATEFLLLLSAALADPASTVSTGLGFRAFAARRLARLGASCRELAGGCRTADDREALRVALRRLRHGLQASIAVLPDPAAATRLVERLAEAQLALGAEQDRLGDRRTAASVIAGARIDAADAARALALIDGFQRFADAAADRGPMASPARGQALDAALVALQTLLRQDRPPPAPP